LERNRRSKRRWRKKISRAFVTIHQRKNVLLQQSVAEAGRGDKLLAHRARRNGFGLMENFD
jgi:hypothetical protein